GQRGGAAVEVQRVGKGDAELVALEAGGDVGVGLRVDVRIDAQRDRRLLAEFAGDRVQVVELGGRFDVEAADAGLQRLAHLGTSLADAGEHHLVGTATGGEHAGELATRDDVETGAEAREYRQDAEVRV